MNPPPISLDKKILMLIMGRTKVKILVLKMVVDLRIVQ